MMPIYALAFSLLPESVMASEIRSGGQKLIFSLAKNDT